MKRLAVLLLALFYFAAGAGFTLREHFCMGEPVGVELGHPAQASDNHRCSRCGMEKQSRNGCCKDEVKMLKCSPDQVLAEAPAVPSPLLAAVLTARLPLFEAPAALLSPAEEMASVHGPPSAQGPPRFLRLRRLLI